MKLGYNVDARKRAVNLTLNEDLLAHVREVTENLSSVVAIGQQIVPRESD